jgi:tetratricopeptide (TPR) repeat protein
MAWAVIAVLFLLLPALPADVIVLTDGTRLEGEIVEESAATLTLRLADRSLQVLLKAHIESIERTPRQEPPPDTPAPRQDPAPETPPPQDAPPPESTPDTTPVEQPSLVPAAEDLPPVPDNLSIEEAFRKDNMSACALYDKGARLIGLGQESQDEQERDALARQAIPHLIQARRKVRDFHQAYYQLGVAHQLIRPIDDDQAKQDLQRAIKLCPDFYEAMVELGDVLSRLQDFRAAKRQYDRALEINPRYAQAYKMRAWAAMKMRMHDQAQADIDCALELEPDDPFAKRIKEIVDKELTGPDWEHTYSHATKHYEVISNASEETARKIAETAEEAYSIYDMLFRSKESADIKFKIEVHGKPADYHAEGYPKQSAGMYNSTLKKLALYEHPDWENTLSVIYHEGFHQYLDLYLKNAPYWFNEGHADFFGFCRKQGSRLVPRPHPWRLDTIQRALKTNQEQPLDEFMQFRRRQFYGPRIGINYAQSWSLTYFLWNYRGGVYRKLLSSYYKALRKGASLEQAYRMVFASRIDRISSEWRTYVAGLELSREDRALLRKGERAPGSNHE